jgi:expansin (peptidoglycan-binding protein)
MPFLFALLSAWLGFYPFPSPQIPENPTSIFLPMVQRSSPAVYRTGEGTYYDATGDGNCMFGPSPQDLMVGAMNQADYNHAALCGAYLEVTGPKGVVTVRIVDRCPECAPGDIDFSPQAFEKIADLVQGRVPIRWRIVSPDLPGPIVYRFKEGSNIWWTAVQIRNHRNPIASVEYLDSGGNYQPMPRTDYNYFLEANGLGPGPYTFRVTDIYGNVLQDAGIPFIIATEIPGGGQFPPMP